MNVQKESKSLLPRQYACSCNVIRNIVDNNYEEAWWELQDIVTASDEEILTYSEMWLICMLVESMMENLR